MQNKLTNTDIVLYGLGGIATTLIAVFKSTFLMIFLSDVVGMDISFAGTITMAVTIFDAINDPIIGGICDRTNSRWGRYRPHMMMGTTLLSVVTVAMFSIPNLSEGMLPVYYTVMMCLFSIFFTQQCIPWQALNSVLTKDPGQRNLLLASRQFFGITSGTAVGVVTLFLVGKLGGNETGWSNTAIVFSVISVLSMYAAAYGARKVDYKDAFAGITKEKVTFREQLSVLKGNNAILYSGLTYGLVGLFNAIRGAASVYYFTYIMNDASLVAKTSSFLLIINFVSIPVVPILLKKFDKKPVLFGSMLACAAFPIAALIMRQDMSLSVMYVSYLITCTAGGIANFAVISLIPDCTDYTYWKLGINSAGMVNSVSTFMQKCCTSLSTFILGSLLGMVGYSVQTAFTEPVTNMIINIVSVVPLVIIALSFITIKLYPIDRKMGIRMRAELAEREAAQAAETAAN